MQIPILNFDLKPKESLMANKNKTNSPVSIRELKLPNSSTAFNNIQPRVVPNNPSLANQTSSIHLNTIF